MRGLYTPNTTLSTPPLIPGRTAPRPISAPCSKCKRILKILIDPPDRILKYAHVIQYKDMTGDAGNMPKTSWQKKDVSLQALRESFSHG